MVYGEHTNPNVNLMRRLFAQGKLSAAQAKFMAARRPEEELYDLEADPWQLNDVAALPGYEKTRARFQSLLQRWIVETDDRGRIPEDPAVVKAIIEDHDRKMERLFGKDPR
jgi:N-sulfoglucosamine sulfohydrolase